MRRVLSVTAMVTCGASPSAECRVSTMGAVVSMLKLYEIDCSACEGRRCARGERQRVVAVGQVLVRVGAQVQVWARGLLHPGHAGAGVRPPDFHAWWVVKSAITLPPAEA